MKSKLVKCHSFSWLLLSCHNVDHLSFKSMQMNKSFVECQRCQQRITWSITAVAAKCSTTGQSQISSMTQITTHPGRSARNTITRTEHILRNSRKSKSIIGIRYFYRYYMNTVHLWLTPLSKAPNIRTCCDIVKELDSCEFLSSFPYITVPFMVTWFCQTGLNAKHGWVSLSEWIDLVSSGGKLAPARFCAHIETACTAYLGVG